jgi:hypothetical protein
MISTLQVIFLMSLPFLVWAIIEFTTDRSK